MRKVFNIGILTVLLLLASCSNDDHEGHMNHDDQTGAGPLITFNVEIIPHNPAPSSETTFRAIATKDGEKIEGATSVKFEVWREGQEEHSMLKASYIKEGTYEAVSSFTKEGNYHLIYHINDVNGIHHMDQLDFTVGNNEGHSAHNDGHDGHGGQGHLIIHNMELTPLKDEEAMLMSHVAINSKALAEANIKYEIVNQNTGETQFIRASEKTTGEYVALFTFKSSGVYEITTHVEHTEKDIHDHKKWTVEVK